MSAGTRSSAMTATAPASSATLACSAVTTSMITPPRSISASPRLTRIVPVVRPVSAFAAGGVGMMRFYAAAFGPLAEFSPAWSRLLEGGDAGGHALGVVRTGEPQRAERGRGRRRDGRPRGE